jgi:hypothetical protein
MRYLRSRQTFSIGFKSGEFAGHTIFVQSIVSMPGLCKRGRMYGRVILHQDTTERAQFLSLHLADVAVDPRKYASTIDLCSYLLLMLKDNN